MILLLFMILYLLSGYIIEKISRKNREVSRSYIIVLLWPAVFLPAIYNVITNRDIKKGGDASELP